MYHNITPGRTSTTVVIRKCYCSYDKELDVRVQIRARPYPFHSYRTPSPFPVENLSFTFFQCCAMYHRYLQIPCSVIRTSAKNVQKYLYSYVLVKIPYSNELFSTYNIILYQIKVREKIMLYRLIRSQKIAPKK